MAFHFSYIKILSMLHGLKTSPSLIVYKCALQATSAIREQVFPAIIGRYCHGSFLFGACLASIHAWKLAFRCCAQRTLCTMPSQGAGSLVTAGVVAPVVTMSVMTYYLFFYPDAVRTSVIVSVTAADGCRIFSLERNLSPL